MAINRRSLLKLASGIPFVKMILSPDLIETAFASDDIELQRLIYLATTHPYYTFEPRPDDPADDEEQTEFCRRNYRWDETKKSYVYDDGLSLKICLGGTGSGKTVAAAYKVAEHLLTIPPPRESCQFWIIGENIDQVCDVAWKEKLSEMIPSSELFCEPVWHNKKSQHPKYVILKHPKLRHRQGWVLHFMSYEQGLGSMKGHSIGGYWLNEEVPYSLIDEIRGRCRDYDSPGWADFTPVENKSPERSEEIKALAIF